MLLGKHGVLALNTCVCHHKLWKLETSQLPVKMFFFLLDSNAAGNSSVVSLKTSSGVAHINVIWLTGLQGNSSWYRKYEESIKMKTEICLLLCGGWCRGDSGGIYEFSVSMFSYCRWSLDPQSCCVGSHLGSDLKPHNEVTVEAFNSSVSSTGCGVVVIFVSYCRFLFLRLIKSVAAPWGKTLMLTDSNWQPGILWTDSNGI